MELITVTKCGHFMKPREKSQPPSLVFQNKFPVEFVERNISVAMERSIPVSKPGTGESL